MAEGPYGTFRIFKLQLSVDSSLEVEQLCEHLVPHQGCLLFLGRRGGQDVNQRVYLGQAHARQHFQIADVKIGFDPPVTEGSLLSHGHRLLVKDGTVDLLRHESDGLLKFAGFQELLGVSFELGHRFYLIVNISHILFILINASLRDLLFFKPNKLHNQFK